MSGPAPAASPAAPRWAIVIAHLIPLCVLPSGLWRLGMAAGVPLGFTAAELRDDYGIPGWGVVYIIALTLVVEALALLSLGLVRPWGERLPRWVPLLGGRGIPTWAAVVPAGLGATALTIAGATQLAIWGRFDHSRVPSMGPAYAPLLAWGPLLAVLTVAYAVRRRGRPGVTQPSASRAL